MEYWTTFVKDNSFTENRSRKSKFRDSELHMRQTIYLIVFVLLKIYSTVN